MAELATRFRRSKREACGMTTERWRQIEEIYQTAADLEARERSDFLTRTCAADPDLRSAVDGLLAADGNVDNAIEAGAARPLLRCGPGVDAGTGLVHEEPRCLEYLDTVGGLERL